MGTVPRLVTCMESFARRGSPHARAGALPPAAPRCARVLKLIRRQSRSASGADFGTCELRRCVPWPMTVTERLIVEFRRMGQRPRQGVARPGRSPSWSIPAAAPRCGDVGQRAAHDLLVGPRGMIDHRRRAVRPVMLRQRGRRLGEPFRGKEDAQRGPRLRPAAKAPRTAAWASGRASA